MNINISVPLSFPSDTHKREKHLTLRIGEDQFSRLGKAASKLGISKSRFARFVLDQAVEQILNEQPSG